MSKVKKRKVDKAKVAEMLAWLDGNPGQGDTSGRWCYLVLGTESVVTTGGSWQGRLCFEMAKPERGLVRVLEQVAYANAPLGHVERSTWTVTELGTDVHVAWKKRERKMAIRNAAIGESLQDA